MDNNTNEEKRLTKQDYFDLREKRLKLVYKILYVVVAIWVSVIVCLTRENLEKIVIPIYSFVLSAASMVIIQIIKYAIMEFRCMKIIGQLSEKLLLQTELRYEYIWGSFSVIFPLCGMALILHYFLIGKATTTHFLVSFFICIGYFMIISVIKLFKRDFGDKSVSVLEGIDIVVGSIAAYSLCAAACLIKAQI